MMGGPSALPPLFHQPSLPIAPMQFNSRLQQQQSSSVNLDAPVQASSLRYFPSQGGTTTSGGSLLSTETTMKNEAERKAKSREVTKEKKKAKKKDDKKINEGNV